MQWLPGVVGGGGHTPLYGQYGKCAAGQSTVTEKNLATLDTNLSHSVLNNRLPNNTQITTNNISGLLCRSRPLRFIEDQLSLKNRTVKNTSRKIKRSFGYVSTRDTRRPGKNRYKNPVRDGKKIEETWVGTKPKNSTTFLRSRKNNNNKTKIYTSYI